MKKLPLIIAVLALLMAAGVGFSLINNHAESSSGRPADEHAEAAHEHADTHDHCAAGETSDLDRTLEDLWAAVCEHDIPHYTCDECRYELGVVKLSDQIFFADGRDGLVSTALPEERTMGRPLSLTGEVVTNDLKSVRAASVVSGVIRKIMTDIGGRVSRGEALFEIDSPEAAEARADYLKKAAAATLAGRTAEREAGLFAKKIAAEVEVLEARNRQMEAEIELAGSRSRLERMGLSAGDIESLAAASPAAVNGILRIPAAIDGMVLERFAGPGDRVEAGQEVMLVSDISEVWINADIREADAQSLSLSGGPIPCEIRSPGGNGVVLPGTLEAVSGKMDETTRTIRARVSVKNPDGRLRPGMFVNVDVISRTAGTAVLAVPDRAVLSDEGRTFVFVHKDGEYWVRRPVETGDSSGGFTEIRQGLARDQAVIADGSFLLKSDVLREKMGAGCAD
ncbi:MAG: efflux RND transporter periplasmic adaptor subunit [Thermodesulfobacteriota bacterium]